MEKSPSPSGTAMGPHPSTAFSAHIQSVVLRVKAVQAKPREWERTVPKSSGLLVTVAPCPGPEQEGKGKARRGQGSGREQWARASFWAPAGPAQFLVLGKPPGQEENLSCEVRGPEEEGSPQNEEVIEDCSQTAK